MQNAKCRIFEDYSGEKWPKRGVYRFLKDFLQYLYRTHRADGIEVD